MQIRVVNILMFALFSWCRKQTKASIAGTWTHMGEMCATGFFKPNKYAYANGTGGAAPGNSLSAAQAKTSLQFCVDVFEDDASCSNEFVGIDPNDGHCWCVDAGEKCTRKQKASIYQFRFVMSVYIETPDRSCESIRGGFNGPSQVGNGAACRHRCDADDICSCALYDTERDACVLQKTCSSTQCKRRTGTNTYLKQTQDVAYPVSPGSGQTVQSRKPFVPHVYWGGQLYPLCGIDFWDNNTGAQTICRALGFFNGSVQKIENQYSKQALAGYGLATPRVSEAACAAGENVGLTITCSKHSFFTQSEANSKGTASIATPAPDVSTTNDPTMVEISKRLVLTVVVVSVSIGGVLVISLVMVTVIACSIRRRALEKEANHVSPVPSPLPTSPSMNIAVEAHALLMQSDLLIGAEEIVMEPRPVASGGGGQVFLGQFGTEQVALKENFASLGCAATLEDQQETIREAGLLTKLRHPHIVAFFGLWSPEQQEEEHHEGLGGRVLLVLEYCANGDLSHQILKPETSMSLRMRWTYQTALALKFLHGRKPPVVHRDIKPENVLLDAKNNAKVADFGGSKLQMDQRDQTVAIGTIAYMPPEALSQSGKEEGGESMKINIDGTKWDVFSYAVMVTYILSGHQPHSGLRNSEIFLKVGMRDGRTPIPQGLDDKNIIQLIKRMWTREPDKRPSFRVIVRELREIQRGNNGSDSDFLSSSDEESTSEEGIPPS